MHPILREAEAAFRGFMVHYEPGRAPGLAQASIIVQLRGGEETEYRVRLLDSQEIRWRVPFLTYRTAPPRLRGDMILSVFAALWDRVREEHYRWVAAQPPLMAPLAMERLPDLRPGVISYEWPMTFREIRGVEEVRQMRERMDRDMRDAFLYGLAPVDPARSAQREAEAQQEAHARRQRDEMDRIARRLSCTCLQCQPPTAAEVRAIGLMRGWLSPEQRAQYDSRQYFEVTGSHSGNRYRIEGGRRSFNVIPFDKKGRAQPRLCFGPAYISAMGDIMLAQKIALETDEAEALKVANVERISPLDLVRIDPW